MAGDRVTTEPQHPPQQRPRPRNGGQPPPRWQPAHDVRPPEPPPPVSGGMQNLSTDSPGYRNTLEALLVRVMAELDEMERRLGEKAAAQAEIMKQLESASTALVASLEIQGSMVEAAKAATDKMAEMVRTEALKLARHERRAGRQAFFMACALCFMAGCGVALWLTRP